MHAQPLRDPPHRTRRRSRNPRTACQSASPTQRRYDGLFAPTTPGARGAVMHAQPLRDPPHRTRRRSRNPRTACQSANPTQRRYDGPFTPTTAAAPSRGPHSLLTVRTVCYPSKSHETYMHVSFGAPHESPERGDDDRGESTGRCPFHAPVAYAREWQPGFEGGSWT